MKPPYWLRHKTLMEWGPTAKTALLLEWLMNEIIRLDLYPLKDEIINETWEMYELRYWKGLLEHCKEDGITGMAKKAGVSRTIIYNIYKRLKLEDELATKLREVRKK